MVNDLPQRGNFRCMPIAVPNVVFALKKSKNSALRRSLSVPNARVFSSARLPRRAFDSRVLAGM
jgi:hypothetical protein